jgi:Icc-related predicted phosphoesterase
MRLLLLSDLHHEVWRQFAPVIDVSISKPDIVILAGDIACGNKAVEWASKTFAGIPVLYVTGNHEYYGHDIESVKRDIQAACHLTSDVHFLDCEQVVHGGVRFLGCTLWTDFKLFGDETCAAAKRAAEASMNDYERIRLASAGHRKLRADDTASFHTQERAWLEARMSEPFNGITVVITHMAPSRLSVTSEFGTDLVSAAYASRFDSLVEKVDLWCHGHMHTSLDYRIGRCRIICNPCGYINRGGGTENKRFDANFAIEI